MPTIGKVSLDGSGAATLPRAGEVALCSRAAVSVGEEGAGGAPPPLLMDELRRRGDRFIAVLRSAALIAQSHYCTGKRM